MGVKRVPGTFQQQWLMGPLGQDLSCSEMTSPGGLRVYKGETRWEWMDVRCAGRWKVYMTSG